ncbi:hypothetical protein BP5796_02153 [Coleophoma crateriformis]|uniref:Zn(2)-C6 fungal-type domain-containing protein n=1 Tax=Coleophoma crateriformis TaxID=565419 RepID=A0A3D8SYZ1_9HELO|nr:hypothetical protein BP5796_02153 [Coleophoma crateriformis]
MEPQPDQAAQVSDLNINELSNVPQGRGRRPRSQTERPCDLCRRRKVGCCIETPGTPCQLCRTLQKECTFVTKPERRPRKRAHVELATAPPPTDGFSSNNLRIGAVLNEVPDTSFGNTPNMSLQSTTSEIGFEDDPEPLRNDSAEQFYPELYINFDWMTPLSPWKQRKITCYPFASGLSDQQHTTWPPLQPSSENQSTFDSNRNESVERAPASTQPLLPVGANIASTANSFPKSPANISRDPGQLSSWESSSLPRRPRKEKCTRYVGPSAAIDPYLLAACQDENQHGPFYSLWKDNGSKHIASFWTSDHENTRSLENHSSTSKSSEELLFSIVPSSQLAAYIALFFKYIYPVFPILSKSWYASIIKSPDALFSLPIGLLAAICGTTMQFAIFDIDIDLDPGYEQETIECLWALVHRELQKDTQVPSLTSLQTLLLFIHKMPKLPSLDDSFLLSQYLGQCVSMTHALGLHVEADSWPIPGWELRLRRRLWWAVYMEDRWRSTCTGQPALISGQRSSIRVLSRDDFGYGQHSESEQHGEGKSSKIEKRDYPGDAFQRLCTLTFILEQVLTAFYVVDTHTTNYGLLLQNAKAIRIKMSAWYADIPQSLHLGKELPEVGDPDSNSALHFAYFMVDILFYRALMQPINQSSLSLECSRSFEGAIDAVFPAAGMCTRWFIDFISETRARNCTAFWYSWCRPALVYMPVFAIMMFIHSRTETEAVENWALLDLWRKVSQTQSRDLKMLQYATSVLRQFDKHGLINFCVIGSSAYKLLESRTPQVAQ